MPNTPIIPDSSIIREAEIARPASREQATDMLTLIMAEILSNMTGADAKMAALLPLDTGEAARSAVEAQTEKDALSHAMQAYAKRYGKLDVPLLALGSSDEARRGSFRPIIEKIAKSNTGGVPCDSNDSL